MLKKIYEIALCLGGIIGAVIASEIDEEVLKIGQSSVIVARDVCKGDMVGKSSFDVVGNSNKEDFMLNTAIIKAEDDGILIALNVRLKLSYKDIADAWERNQNIVYTSLTALSIMVFYHVRFHKI